MAQRWAVFVDVLRSCGGTEKAAAAAGEGESHAAMMADAIHHRAVCGVLSTGEKQDLGVAMRTAETGPRWVEPAMAAVAVVGEPGP